MTATPTKGSISLDQRFERFDNAVGAVDLKYKPDISIYKKNKLTFLTQWKRYEKKSMEAVDACKLNMKVSKNPNGTTLTMISPGSAKVYLSRIKSRLSEKYDFVPPHFDDEVKKLIKKNPKHKTMLSKLLNCSDNPQAISKKIGTIKGNLPDSLESSAET